MLINLLSEQSLAEVNRYLAPFGKRCKKPKPATRARVVEQRETSFYSKLMQTKPKGGGYHQR